MTYDATKYIHHSLLVSMATHEEHAPKNQSEARRMGGKWTSAEFKELNNHSRNASWEFMPESDLPRGRRLHKLVWVYKVKRGGTAKARLCVQGCTMVLGEDFDQVFAHTLRTSSVRALFAYAARFGCKVRSVDWVAAY